MIRQGQINVDVRGLAGEAAPVVEVRDEQLRLQRRVTANDPFNLDPGTYVLTAALPDGSRVSSVAEVSPGAAADVSLDAAESVRLDAAEPLESVYAGGGVAVPTADRQVAGQEPSEVDPPALHVRRQATGATGRKPELRLDEGKRSGGMAEMSFTAEATFGTEVAQFATEGRVPVNVALPMSLDSLVRSCKIDVSTSSDGEVGVKARPQGHPELELVAGYLESGQIDAAVAVRAERFLKGKLADPFGAAIGGYALLRLGELERLHDWAFNLASWFPWLPDGAVIAGEQLAQAGDQEQATEWFAEAIARGRPVFSDGLSLLVSRLREHARAEKLPTPLRDFEPQVFTLIQMSPFVDFSRLTTTSVGMHPRNPAGSQVPLTDPEREGWTELPWIETKEEM